MPRRTGLAKSLCKRGFCSRSQAFALVRAGRVSVNGVVCRNPELTVDVEHGRIEVDGSAVGNSQKIYWMLNKPRGLVTTASDEKERQTVYECLPAGLPHLSPVGRLDKASEGLLLLTNDSEWAARITAPKTHMNKTYHVQVAAVADAEPIECLRRGVRSDGHLLRAKSAGILRGGQKNTWIEIILDEGKNRHIRRMFESMDVEVLRLIRVAVGPLVLGNLPKGSARILTSREKQSLDIAMLKLS